MTNLPTSDPNTPTPIWTPADQQEADALIAEIVPHDAGLQIDMLDADRLRAWSRNLTAYGADITQWGSLSFVAAELLRIADAMESAIVDVGGLRETNTKTTALLTRARDACLRLTTERGEMQWVVDNIYTIARRESKRPPDKLRPEMWAHVLRLCERTDARTRTVGILRDRLTDGDGHPSKDAHMSEMQVSNPAPALDPRIAELEATVARLTEEKALWQENYETACAALLRVNDEAQALSLENQRLTTENEKLSKQAIDISTWLSEAGIGPCPIPEGVKALLHRAEAAEATVARLAEENKRLRADLTAERGENALIKQHMDAMDTEAE